MTWTLDRKGRGRTWKICPVCRMERVTLSVPDNRWHCRNTGCGWKDATDAFPADLLARSEACLESSGWGHKRPSGGALFSGGVQVVRFLLAGRQVVSGGHEGDLVLWDLPSGAKRWRIWAHFDGTI